MKKLSKLLSVCAILALLIACAVFSVSADATEVQPNTLPSAYDGTTACPHCGQSNIEWIDMANQDYHPSSDLHLVVEADTTLDITTRMDLNCSDNDAEIVIWVKGDISIRSGVYIFIGNSYAESAENPTEVWLVGGGGNITAAGIDSTTNGTLRLFKRSTMYITNDLTISNTSPSNNGARAGVLDINQGTVYMQGGTINGYTTTGASSKGTVYLRTGASGTPSSFIMTGGTVNGSNISNHGGAIYMSGAYTSVQIGENANVYGSAIGTSSSGRGSAIYQAGSSNSSVLINGNAKIFGGSSYTGGVIYVNHNAEISGNATIVGGSASYGGISYVNTSGVLTIDGNAQLYGGTASSYGGAIYSNGTLNISGGTINGGSAVTGGGAIGTNGGSITITGGTISGGSAPNGGTIYLLSSAGTVNINGGTINGGTADEAGGAIYQAGGSIVMGNCTAYPNGATLTGGTAPEGGAIYVENGTLTVNNGTVNGSVAEKGGAVYLTETGSFAMTGGTVNGCTVDNTTETVVLGGAIYLENANAETMTFTGGTINGGTIRRDANEAEGITKLDGLGGSIYAENGTLTLAGTDLTGGYAYQGCAVYMLDGTLTIAGSDITNTRSTSYGGAIRMKDGTLNMVSGSISNNTGTRGGGIYLDAGTMNMSGGTISNNNGTRGGNMYLAGSLTMTGGTISGGSATEYAGGIFMAGNKTYNINGGTIENNSATGSTAPGGNLHIYNGDLKIEDTAGKVIIRNGTANKGGNISVSQASSTDKSTTTINLTRADSLISGGTAPTGAGIYVQGTLTLTSGTINGGKATTGGGCVYIVNGGTFNMNGGTLNGGTTTATKAKYGGCVHVYGGTFNLNNGTLNGGSVTSGAAVYLEKDSNDKSAVMNMTGGTVNNGTVTAQGALAYVGSSTTLNMTGGVMRNTSAGDVSGIRVQGSGKVYLHGDAHVMASAGGRNGVDLVGTGSTPATLVLAGNAKVGDVNGEQTNVHNITLQSYTNPDNNKTYYPKIQVANDWTGYASITDNFGSTASGEYICVVGTTHYAQCGTWDAEALTFTQGGTFASPNLIHGGADEGDLPIFGEEGKLMLPRAKAIVEGTTTWHRTADEAADTACGGGYAVLYKDDTAPITLNAGDTLYMDFNGFTAPVNGEGTLYGMDSSALATGEGTSQVTFEGVDVKTLAKNPATGDSYIAIKDGNTATFHAVTANITSVSIRPGTVGMYYSAQFVCDDTVKAYLDNFGIAVSLQDMPGTDFATDKKSMYTRTEGKDLANGEFNSVLIQNIMIGALDGATNKSRGEMPIYANAYMNLTIDGEPITIMSTNTSEFSLKTLLQHVNTYWDTFAETAQASLATNIYDPYVRDFEGDDWGIYNIRIQANGGYTEEEKAILAERRQIVMDYMRESVSLLWRSDKTITYGLGNTERDKGASFTIQEGRLYKGLPYVYGAGTQDAFLEYATAKDENGIYTISNIEATALNYESYGGRVGNDCSGAVTNAWSLISPSITGTTSSACAPYFGIVPVGNYAFNSPVNPDTHRILDTKYVVDTNGEQTMYEAYAMLQPGDAAYHQEYPSTKGNHIRMVVSVNVVRNADNTIDGTKSTITMLEQTRTQINANKTEKHPVTGETIYVIGGVDKTYKFSTLFGEHYIPVTVAELRDPSALEETWVDDTLEEDTIENLFTGSIITNRYLDSVRITIYNENGEIVQQSTGRRSRSVVKEYVMSRFLTEKPGSTLGRLDLDALEAGNYRCTVTVKLTIDDDYVHTARDFTFSK